IAATTISYDAGIADLTAVGSYSDRNNAADNGTQLMGPLGAPALGGTQSSGADTHAWTGEIRAASKDDGPVQWLVGGYAYSETRDSRNLMQIGFGQVTVTDLDATSDIDERAVFGELSYA